MSECKCCGVEVTDEILKHVYYDPKHPTIDIGPYCFDCANKIRRCYGCYHPFTTEDVGYHGNGIYFCRSCETNIFECPDCGSKAVDGETVGGRKICRHCFDTNYIKCDCCDVVFNKAEGILDPLTKMQYKGMFSKYASLCKTCFDTQKSRFKKYDVEQCRKCNKFYTPDDKCKDGYCGSCVRNIPTCKNCGKLDHRMRNQYADNTLSQGSSSINLCNACTTRLFLCQCNRYSKKPVLFRGSFGYTKKCNHCSPGGNNGFTECKHCLEYTEVGADGMCVNCRRNNHTPCSCGSKLDEGGCRSCDGGARIYNYTRKPTLNYNYTDKDKKNGEAIFFGIEREVSYGPDREAMELQLKRMYKTCGPDLLLAKHDGSIRGSGYEIVTQPMTLDFFYSKFPIHALFNEDIRYSDSCGMHIHVGRNAIKSQVHLLKVLNFIYDNESFIDKLCGRTYNNYNSKMDNKASTALVRAQGYSRSCRVNLTNHKTIEFRMFAQAANEFEFKYRVEFTVAIIEFTKTVGIKDATVDNFKIFIANKYKKFPALNKYLSL